MNRVYLQPTPPAIINPGELVSHIDLPTLLSPDIHSTILWAEELRNLQRRTLGFNLEFEPLALIAPEVCDEFERIVGEELDGTLEDIIEKLCTAFQYPSAAASVALLRQLAPTAVSTNLKTCVARVAALRLRYPFYVTALNIDHKVAKKLFVEFLDGEVKVLVKRELAASGAGDLDEVMDLAINWAAEIDRARIVGIIPATSSSTSTRSSSTTTSPTTGNLRIYGRYGTHTAPAPSTSSSTSTPSPSASPPGSPTDAPPPPPPAQAPAPPASTPVKRERTTTPLPRDVETPGASTSRSSGAPRVTGSGLRISAPSGHPTPSSVDRTGSAAPRRPLSFRRRPENKGFESPAHPVVVDKKEKFPAPAQVLDEKNKDPKPVTDQEKKPHVTPVPASTGSDGRIHIHAIAFSHRDHQGVVDVVVDCGAVRSHISTRYARALGLTLETIPPKLFETITGEVVSIDKVAKITMRLLHQARKVVYTLFVNDRTPPGLYVIIGAKDLAGYCINMTSPPTLTWMDAPNLEDHADPLQPPEPHDAPLEPGQPAPFTLVQIGDRLSAPQAQQVQGLLRRCGDVFGPLTERPANLPPFQLTLKPGTEPVRQRVRPQPPNKREFVAAEVARMSRLGLIQPSTSSWASPIVVVTKSNGKFRLCVDYTVLNKHTVRDASPIPRVREIFESFAGKPFMASFDLVSGYNQVLVDPAARPLLAFVTHVGLYEPVRLPFGPTNAPAHFQRELARALTPLQSVRTYIDDVGLATATFDQFLTALEEFFTLVDRLGLKLNAEKSRIGPTLLPYIGRLIGPTSIQIDPDRLGPLLQLRAPQTKEELRSFLGLANYFSEFVSNLAIRAGPLWDLLHDDVVYAWSTAHQTAFEDVRNAIGNAPILAQFIPGAVIVIRPDGSSFGIGGVVFQINPDSNKYEILFFFGRKLTDAEAKYSTIEIECLGVVTGIDKARPYIMSTVIVITDHSNLQFLGHSSNRRVQRWAIILSEFDLTIIYRPGRDNAIADCLSRLLPGTTAASSRPPEPAHALREVPEQITHDLTVALQSQPGEVVDGVKVLTGTLPPQIVTFIWALAHNDALAGHFGELTTNQVVSSAVRWGGMTEDLAKLTRACPACQKMRARPAAPAEILSTRANFPFESIMLDYVGPLRDSGGYKYILTIVDRFSHWLVLAPTQDTTAETTTWHIWNSWICVNGVPTRMTSDGGSAFMSRLLEKVTDLLNIQHHLSCPGHPEGHGAVERANHTVTQVVRAHFERTTGWHQLVRPAAFAINCAYSRLLGASPFEVVHGFQPRLPLHAALGTEPRHHETFDPSEFTDCTVAAALRLFPRIQEIQKDEFEKQLARIKRQIPNHQYKYKLGDFVLVHRPRPEKLLLPWKGPFEIVAIETDKIFLLRGLVNNHEMRAHVNSLHPFLAGTLTREQLTVVATEHDEFLVERVLAHRIKPGTGLQFRLKFAGYPELLASDPVAWTDVADCRFSPVVHDYAAQHALDLK